MKTKDKTKKDKKALKIYIRSLERRDIPTVVSWLAGADYRDNNPTDYPVTNVRDLKNQLLKEITVSKFIYAGTQLLVAEVEDGIILGVAVLKKIDWRNRHLNLQVHIPKDFRQPDILLSITNQVYQYVFRSLNMHKVYTHVLGDNQDKIKIHRDHGHEPEVILCDYVFDGQNYHDLYVYAIYRRDIT